MKKSRKTMPVGELNLDESIDMIKSELLEKKEEKRSIFIERVIDNVSLYELANYTTYECTYAPYLLDFGIVIERIKGKNETDNSEESLKVKMDLLEQLSKMENVPQFCEECHIESDKFNKCTSISSFIRKNIFRKKKYRLVFHGREAKYEETLYKTLLGGIIYALF